MAYKNEVALITVPLSPAHGKKLTELTAYLKCKSKTQLGKKLLEATIDEEYKTIENKKRDSE